RPARRRAPGRRVRARPEPGRAGPRARGPASADVRPAEGRARDPELPARGVARRRECHAPSGLSPRIRESSFFRDDDGTGVPNSWSASTSVHCVSLARPFLGDGVPPHYIDDRGFQRWLMRSGKHADVLTDDDLDRLTGAQLARRYDLVVFPWHHEYVTARE